MSEPRRSFWQFWKRAPEPEVVAPTSAEPSAPAVLRQPASAAAVPERAAARREPAAATPSRSPASSPVFPAGPATSPAPDDHAIPGDSTPSDGTPPTNAPASDEPDAYEPPRQGSADGSVGVATMLPGRVPRSAGGAVRLAPDASTAVTASAVGSGDTDGWFGRLRRGLGRSSNRLGESLAALYTKAKLDTKSLQALEDILIEADLGIETAMAITDRLSEGRYAVGITPHELQTVLAEEVERVLSPLARPLDTSGAHPFVILVVGVNGTGKTTTIGKIAAREAAAGRKLVLVAGDTFRAAAVEQLKIWGERAGARVISGSPKADAAGLVFEALDAAQDADVLVIDTAGRLQNKTELMAELEKIVRIVKRRIPDAPHAVLLTLDATTGQNALNQVDVFRDKVGVTGLVMTKLDGTARGGILVAIAKKHRLPIHFIGVGEGIDDLAPFAARDFARAIAGL